MALEKGRVSTSQNKEDKGGCGSDMQASNRKGKQAEGLCKGKSKIHMR